MAYDTTRQLIRDVLQRCGEPWQGESDFSQPNIVLRYINRAYDILQVGGGELDPAIQIDWYWLRAYPPGAFVLVPEVETTVTVVQNSTQITFPVLSDLTRNLSKDLCIVRDEPTAYTIAENGHTVGGGVATLTAPYVGLSGTKPCRFAKVSYNLAANCLRLLEPMQVFVREQTTRTLRGAPYEVNGISKTRMQELYPLAELSAGVPRYFAFVRDAPNGTERVQFNRSGPRAGDVPIMVQYEYLVRPNELVDADGELPKVPLEHRRVLSDIAAWLIFVDKDDNRAAIAREMAVGSLRSMAQDHRSREGRLSKERGKIFPRDTGHGRWRGRLVTAG